MAGMILLSVKILMKNEIVSASSIEKLRQLLLNSEDETNLNRPVRCFVSNSKQATECEHRLCFATIADRLGQSCINDTGIIDGKVHLTMTLVAGLTQQIEKMAPVVSYTCNVDQCNSNDTINQVKDALGGNSNNFVALVSSMNIVEIFSSISISGDELSIVPGISNSTWKWM
jgi:hypothetical protein